ncbi:hypothetical protein ACV355_29775, partial [Pseudomonas aeruginosa]
IKQLALLQVDESGILSSINIDYGKNREDVGAYFSEFEQAAHSGYIVYGSFSTSVAQHRLKLLCTYEDGTPDSIDVPESHYI